MSEEYIEREAAIAETRKPRLTDAELRRRLAHIPAADVRTVVLCRDCKHSKPWYADKSRCFLWHESGIDVFNDGFCNYGEKREES